MVWMKKLKYAASIVLLIVLVLVTYMYINKKPLESAPNRATLVYEQRAASEGLQA
ncbi:MAG: hypothetical protein K0R84_1177 [Clostridia bacterium]|nr:hypothetical protein [Clostridia bacterium]